MDMGGHKASYVRSLMSDIDRKESGFVKFLVLGALGLFLVHGPEFFMNKLH